jgi:hypothetical protein
MEMLVFEEFPAEAKSSWEKQRDVAVVERDSSSPFPRFRFGPSRDADGKHSAAKEQINYTVLKRNNNPVEISRKYSLLTSPEADKPSRFEMTGEGQFTFDLAEGAITTCSMKYECHLNEKNVIVKIPITLTYHLLSPEEMAEQKKKSEEARAAMKKAQEPKDFGPGERARLLKDLRSTDTQNARGFQARGYIQSVGPVARSFRRMGSKIGSQRACGLGDSRGRKCAYQGQPIGRHICQRSGDSSPGKIEIGESGRGCCC